jgi:hypothetical protein
VHFQTQFEGQSPTTLLFMGADPNLITTQSHELQSNDLGACWVDFVPASIAQKTCVIGKSHADY